MFTLFTYSVLAFGMILILREDMRYRQRKEKEAERNAALAILSHQLRTPLTSGKWYVELLKGHELGDLTIAQLDATNQIDRCLEASIALLNRYLEVSRAERGGLVFQFVSIDLNKMIRDVVTDLSCQIEEKKLHVHIDGKEITSVFSDPILLRATLSSVVINAICYTPEGGTVDISIKKKGDKVLVHVRDSGIGIPSNERPRVFNKFFRGEQAKKLYPNGNGLGLYLAQKLLEGMNGKIRFTSEGEDGTTFSLELPES